MLELTERRQGRTSIDRRTAMLLRNARTSSRRTGKAIDSIESDLGMISAQRTIAANAVHGRLVDAG